MIVTKGYSVEDVPRLIEINFDCYKGVELPTHSQFADMLTNDVFVVRCRSCRSTLVWADDVIGFAICKPSGPYLWSIAVDPEFQGRGVGGNLLREVIKYYTLTKEKEITLHCKPDNPAQKLYFDYGFRVEAIAPHWYGRNELGLFMRRHLP